MTKTLLSFGHGFSARALACRLLPQGWQIIGTTRSAEKADALAATGVTPRLWPGDDLRADLANASFDIVALAPSSTALVSSLAVVCKVDG